MLLFVKLTEKNDWENETWHQWIQETGNSEELDKLNAFLEKHDPDGDTYELFDYFRTEAEVDLLVEEADYGYHKSHSKLKGKLNLGDLDQVHSPDDILYKGRIEEFISE